MNYTLDLYLKTEFPLLQESRRHFLFSQVVTEPGERDRHCTACNSWTRPASERQQAVRNPAQAVQVHPGKAETRQCSRYLALEPQDDQYLCLAKNWGSLQRTQASMFIQVPCQLLDRCLASLQLTI